MLITDSTHVKANANKHHYTKQEVLQKTMDYIEELNEAVREDRKAHGNTTSPLRRGCFTLSHLTRREKGI